jgi:hypothetical protein
MPETTLPPGPWRILGVDHSPMRDREFVAVHRIIDPDGQDILIWDGVLTASPEVLRAVCALPLLVEAMRASIEDLESDAESPRHRTAFRLRQALILVDGEGRAE